MYVKQHERNFYSDIPQKSNIQLFQLRDNRPRTLQLKRLQGIIQHKGSMLSNHTMDILQKKANSTGLPQTLKNGVEQLSGHAMDDVKVHYNSSKPAMVQAHAYAQGNQVHLGPGQEKHLPHEAWHVVQQKQGRVRPTKQLKGKMDINDDTNLEREADVMGSRALQLQGYSKNTSLTQISRQSNTIQRKLGLELEVPIPIDRLGVLSKEDKEVLSGKKRGGKYNARFLELCSKADAGYGEFKKVGRVALHADHSKRVLPKNKVYPARVFGKSILEMVFNPAVETFDDLNKTMLDIKKIMAWVEKNTDGLTKRVNLGGGRYVGPIDGIGRPPQLNWNAMIHVNLGLDPRGFHHFFSWYGGSKYKPSKEFRQIPMDVARSVAENVVQTFVKAEQISKSDAQFWNGLRGLTMIYVIYLLSGNDTSPLGSTVKNFATILAKTRFGSIKKYSFTPLEKEMLDLGWETYKKILISLTRPKDDMNSPLIRRTNKKGVLKDGSWKVRHLFGDGEPILVGNKKEIKADDVGPVRSKRDKVTGGGKRKGIILEFRSLPGRYPPNEWYKIASDFMYQANISNSLKDYKELPPKKKIVPKKEKKDSASRVKKIQNLPLTVPQLPAVASVKKNDITIEQKKSFWIVGNEVQWEGALWKVINKEGIKKYTLSHIRDL